MPLISMLFLATAVELARAGTSVGATARGDEQFSRGHRIGTGCCRAAMRASDSGGLGAWEEPPTAEAIAGKRVHGGPMNRTACAVQCAALAGCTHFELNMHGSAAHSNHGQCSVFASGGYSVTTACKASSERMVCFAAGEAFTGSGLALSKSLLESKGRANGTIVHNSNSPLWARGTGPRRAHVVPSSRRKHHGDAPWRANTWESNTANRKPQHELLAGSSQVR